MRQAVVALGIAGWIEDRPDRSRNGGAIAMSAATAIDGAGVQTGPAADAMQSAAEIFAMQDIAASVINEHDMQFAARDRTVKVG